MAETQSRRLWVAYGESGVVGTIKQDADGYTAALAGADQTIGTYPTMDVAKNALHSHLAPGSDWPQFREH